VRASLAASALARHCSVDCPPPPVLLFYFVFFVCLVWLPPSPVSFKQFVCITYVSSPLTCLVSNFSEFSSSPNPQVGSSALPFHSKDLFCTGKKVDSQHYKTQTSPVTWREPQPQPQLGISYHITLLSFPLAKAARHSGQVESPDPRLPSFQAPKFLPQKTKKINQ